MKNEYLNNYIKNNIRRFEIKLSRIYDPELINWLESKQNLTEYIKNLVVEDMKKGTD